MGKLFNDQGGMEKIRLHLEAAKARMPESVRSAHCHCRNNRAELMLSDTCGCFYCLMSFPPSEIVRWLDDGKTATALCPRCEIDSVIGSASGFPMTQTFPSEMKRFWF